MIPFWSLAPFLALPLAGYVLAQTLGEQLDTVENLVIGSTGLVAVAIPACLLLWRSMNAAQQRHIEELQRTIERLQREIDLNRPVYGQPGPPPARYLDSAPVRPAPSGGAAFPSASTQEEER